MDEVRIVTSPTRGKKEPARNGARASKGMEEGTAHSLASKVSQRPQRSSQPLKAGKAHASIDSVSNLMRPPGPDAVPRRTKSNPGGHVNASPVAIATSSSPGQVATAGHSSGTSAGQGSLGNRTSSLVGQREQGQQVTSALAASLPIPATTNLSLLTSASHDLSPNLAHRVVSSTQHNLPMVKKPALASYVSVPILPPQHLDGNRQRMLERANKARLYFLRQSGPNKFLIGGDSYDSRFHVNIGPQTCSCNKANCVHLLFVMLRVLKVMASSPMLWAKPLRNYEVESLLKNFQVRISQRTATPRRSKKKFDFLRRSHDSAGSGGQSTSGHSTPGTSAGELSPPVSPGNDEEDRSDEKRTPPNKLSGLIKAVDEGTGEEGEEEEEGERVEQEGEEPECGDSDKEEDICPICLNELDEGEDLLKCPGCCNHLHQHCMDIWAMEERRKNKNKMVHCPVCRASWPHSMMASPSGSFGPDVLPVSVPVGGAANEASGKVSGGGAGTVALSEEKALLLMSLKEVFGGSSGSARMDSLFSSDWRARETALNDIAREAISLLLPHSSGGVGDHTLSGLPVDSSISGHVTPPRVECHRVQQVCMDVVKHSCADSVLKVFLAALDLLKLVLVYSLCPTKQDCRTLQDLIRPVLSFLLTRCADAQKRVKECSIEAVCNLCLGQDGPLSVGSARGHVSNLHTTDLNFVLQGALSGQDKNETNWRWWLGRLHFMESILSRFSQDYLLSQCVIRPANSSSIIFDSLSDEEESCFGSEMVSPSDSITSSTAASVISEIVTASEAGNSDSENPYLMVDELQDLSDRFLRTDMNMSITGAINASSVQMAPLSSSALPPAAANNLLMQAWFFAARATHIPQGKLSRVARRVIIRIAKTLRDDPSSLEVAHTVVSQCHRTQAEGLLDRVLHAREGTSHVSSAKEGPGRGVRAAKALDMNVSGSRRKSGERSPGRPTTPKSREITPVKSDSSPKSSSLNVSAPQLRSSSPTSLSQNSTAATTPQLSSSPVLPKRRRSPSRTTDQLADGCVGASGESASSGRDEPLAGAMARSASVTDRKRMSRQKSRSSVKNATGGASEEFVESDESFRSALSDFDPDCSNETVVLQEMLDRDKEEGEGSSGSHDSRRSDSRGKQQSSASSSSGGSGSRGVEPLGALPGFTGRTSHAQYMRQSTADSIFSTDSTDTDGSGWGVYACKHNIEQEEAEDLARVRSMEVQDMPHPALSLAPPTAQVLIHVQASGKKGFDETDQASVGKPYLEGFHWVKGKLIGTGAFCSCYLARDMENGTMFAVKQVSFARNTESQEAEELSRLRGEVAMLGRMNHPNIVRCLGATQIDRHINIFVEWMAGGCLDQLLHDFGQFGENVICNYTRQITRGIVFLHENDIIHRDLKGGNILVDSTGQKLRIADFGAAARLATHNTGSGEFQNMEGTVAFMAPEVVKGGSEDASGYGRKCDVWSIGCVIVQMVTAKPPWAGTYDPKVKFQLIFKIGQATGPPPMPEFSNPALKDFALRCLEVNPKDRPTSMELLRHPLYRLEQNEPHKQ